VLAGVRKDGNRLTAALDGDIEFREYSTDDVPDEWVGYFDAFADFSLVPNRFSWFFRQTYSQGSANPLAAPSGLNRETASTFSSGPQLDIPFGDRTTFSLDGTYTSKRYHDNEILDGESVAAEIGLFRRVSRRTRVGLIADRTEYEFDANLTPYAVEGVGFLYENQLLAGEAYMEVGQNTIDFADTSSSGPRYRLAWSRALSSFSHVRIAASREFTDYGTATPVDSGLLLLSSSPLDRTWLELTYRFTTPSTIASFLVAASEDEFLTDPTLNNDSAWAKFGLDRSLGTQLRLVFSAELVRRNYHMLSIEEDRFVSLALEKTLKPRLTFEVEASYYERRGETPVNELLYELRLSYGVTR
jgi:hypothetical protein